MSLLLTYSHKRNAGRLSPTMVVVSPAKTSLANNLKYLISANLRSLIPFTLIKPSRSRSIRDHKSVTREHRHLLMTLMTRGLMSNGPNKKSWNHQHTRNPNIIKTSEMWWLNNQRILVTNLEASRGDRSRLSKRFDTMMPSISMSMLRTNTLPPLQIKLWRCRWVSFLSLTQKMSLKSKNIMDFVLILARQLSQVTTVTC